MKGERRKQSRQTKWETRAWKYERKQKSRAAASVASVQPSKKEKKKNVAKRKGDAEANRRKSPLSAWAVPISAHSSGQPRPFCCLRAPERAFERFRAAPVPRFFFPVPGCRSGRYVDGGLLRGGSRKRGRNNFHFGCCRAGTPQTVLESTSATVSGAHRVPVGD